MVAQLGLLLAWDQVGRQGGGSEGVPLAHGRASRPSGREEGPQLVGEPAGGCVCAAIREVGTLITSSQFYARGVGEGRWGRQPELGAVWPLTGVGLHFLGSVHYFFPCPEEKR